MAYISKLIFNVCEDPTVFTGRFYCAFDGKLCNIAEISETLYHVHEKLYSLIRITGEKRGLEGLQELTESIS